MITNKISKIDFVDDSTSANVKRIQWLLYDDTKSDLDNDYSKGNITYNFETNEPFTSGVKSLVEAATIKTAIEAIKLDKAKDGTYFTSNPLPTLVSSTTVKDGAGVVTSYNEVY